MIARLVMIVPTFPRLSETFIVSKFLGLLEHGWDAHIVCSSVSRTDWPRFPELVDRPQVHHRVHTGWPVRPHWLAGLLMPAVTASCLACSPGRTARYLRRGWHVRGADAMRLLYIDAPLVRLRPDIVHIEFGALAAERAHLRDLLGCKVVTSFRGYDINYSGLDDPHHYDALWEGLDAVHCLGTDLWGRAVARGCPPSMPHALIPPAIDVDRFAPAPRATWDATGTPERPLQVLSVGRIKWEKGHEFSLQAIRLLLDAGVAAQYRIIGDGKHLEAVSFARHQLGLEEHVELLLSQPRDGVKAQLAATDVFLHSADSEGFCNAVVEAQAMGIPVVTTDAGGLGENVADGETGFVVPRRDPQALADRLAQLARDPAMRARMGAAGRERVSRRFRIQDQIDAFDRFYRSVLSDEPMNTGPTDTGCATCV